MFKRIQFILRMRYKRDISKDDYRNPYYPRRSVKVNKTGILSVILLIVLGYWGYLVFYSPYLKIKQININNLEYIKREEILDIVQEQMQRKKFFIFKQDRFFLLDKEELDRNIQKKFLLDKLELERDGLTTLSIDIKEKVSSITWISSDKYYYLDIDGNIKREVEPEEVDRNFPIIYDGEKEGNNSKIIEGAHIKNAVRIIDEIAENTNFEVICFEYFADENLELYAKTNKGFKIYFALNSDINEQLESLYVLLGQGIDIENKTIDYIDLRFGDRVYYK